MFCTNCGNSILEGQHFCTSCGKAITKTTFETPAKVVIRSTQVDTENSSGIPFRQKESPPLVKQKPRRVYNKKYLKYFLWFLTVVVLCSSGFYGYIYYKSYRRNVVYRNALEFNASIDMHYFLGTWFEINSNGNPIGTPLKFIERKGDTVFTAPQYLEKETDYAVEKSDGSGWGNIQRGTFGSNSYTYLAKQTSGENPHEATIVLSNKTEWIAPKGVTILDVNAGNNIYVMPQSGLFTTQFENLLNDKFIPEVYRKLNEPVLINESPLSRVGEDSTNVNASLNPPTSDTVFIIKQVEDVEKSEGLKKVEFEKGRLAERQRITDSIARATEIKSNIKQPTNNLAFNWNQLTLPSTIGTISAYLGKYTVFIPCSTPCDGGNKYEWNLVNGITLVAYTTSGENSPSNVHEVYGYDIHAAQNKVIDKLIYDLSLNKSTLRECEPRFKLTQTIIENAWKFRDKRNYTYLWFNSNGLLYKIGQYNVDLENAN